MFLCVHNITIPVLIKTVNFLGCARGWCDRQPLTLHAAINQSEKKPSSFTEVHDHNGQYHFSAFTLKVA